MAPLASRMSLMRFATARVRSPSWTVGPLLREKERSSRGPHVPPMCPGSIAMRRPRRLVLFGGVESDCFEKGMNILSDGVSELRATVNPSSWICIRSCHSP